MNRYEATLTLNVDIGHMAASALRDGAEDALQGMLEPGESVSVELVSGTQLDIHFDSYRELGDMEEIGLRDALEDVLQGAVDADRGETVSVGQFTAVDVASPAAGPRM